VKKEKKLGPPWVGHPLGRTPIGSHGVASILIFVMGGSYELETTKDGQTLVVNQTFGPKLELDEEVGYTSFCSNKPDETSITIRDLKFDSSQLSLANLKKKIQWELPIHLDNFNVAINGDLLEPKKYDKGMAWKIDETGVHMGRVTGEIYLFDRNQAQKGIHVYVNKRGCGDPAKLLRDLANPSVASKIIAEIDADGLDSIVDFGRGGFLETHPAYIEFTDMLRGVLREIRTFNDQNRRYESKSSVNKLLSESIDSILTRFAVLDSIPEISPETLWEFTELDSNSMGRYDSNANTVYLNRDHPIFSFNSKSKKPAMGTSIELAIVDILAQHRATAERFSFHRYEEAKLNLLSELRPKEIEWAGEGILKKGLYTEREIRLRLGDMTAAELRYVTKSRALVSERERISGQNFLDYLKLTHGYVPIYTLALEFDNVTTKMIGLNNFFESLGKKAEPIVINLGIDQNCYFVHESCITLFNGMVDNLSDAKSDASREKLFGSVFGQEYARGDMSKRFDGVGRNDVQRTLEYGAANMWKRKSLPQELNLLQFVGALQQMKMDAYKH